jgi:hypothetical protein
MRTARILMLMIVITLFAMVVIENGRKKPEKINIVSGTEKRVEREVSQKEIPPIFELISALIQVESTNNDSAVNHRTNAVGCLQIRPIMVREVNRIQEMIGGDRRFSDSDRYSRVKSVAMFMIWYSYHHRDHSFERIARCWNGGPKGYKYKSTIKYWNKVKRRL